jgi:hypothetical protein
MYIFTLVADVRKVIEGIRATRGEFKLAMLYNLDLDASTNWNLIVSSDWTDALGTPEATKIIARELHQRLGLENKAAISRVTVLKTSDPFVRDMARLYPIMSPAGGVPLKQVTAGGITEGAGFVFYSQPEVPV